MKVCQRCSIIEPLDFRKEAFEQAQQTVRPVDEAIAQFTGIDAFLGLAFIHPAFGAGGIFGGRHPEQRQKIAAFEMRAFFGKLGRAFALDQRRSRIGKIACRIVLRRSAHCLREERPARAKAAQHTVEPCGRCNQLSRRCAIEIRSPEARGALETAILVEDDALRDERRPRKKICEQ